MRQFWAMILGIIISFAVTPAVRAVERLTVVYSSIGGGMWPPVAAQKKGMFAKNGLEITYIFIESGSRAINVLLSGEAPIVQGLGGPAPFSATLGGADIVVVASLVNTLSFDLMVTKEISRPEDLKGKRLAISRFGSTTDVGGRLALKKLGIDSKDVAFLQVGSNPARLNAMLTGQVQGALLNSDTHAPLARKQGLRTLASLPDLGIEFLQSSTVTTRSYAKSNPQIVRQYLKSLVEAIAWLKDERNRQEAQQIMAAFIRNQDRELLDGMYDALVKKVFRPVPYPTAGAAQNILDELALTNPKAKQANPKDFIDDRFLRELDESGFLKGLYQR